MKKIPNLTSSQAIRLLIPQFGLLEENNLKFQYIWDIYLRTDNLEYFQDNIQCINLPGPDLLAQNQQWKDQNNR